METAKHEHEPGTQASILSMLSFLPGVASSSAASAHHVPTTEEQDGHEGQEQAALEIENKRLRIKIGALEKQVQLLSSSSSSSSGMTAAGTQEADADADAGRPSFDEEEEGDELELERLAEVQRLQRVVEEQEELLHGLRTTLREICLSRDPVTLERDALRAELARERAARAAAEEEKAALAVVHGKVQQQLRRTADRCQELEAYVRFVEAQQQQQQQQSPQCPRRPPMVHDPVAAAAAGLDGRKAATEDEASAAGSASPEQELGKGDGEGEEPPTRPGFLRWLVSSILVYEDEEEDEGDEGEWEEEEEQVEEQQPEQQQEREGMGTGSMPETIVV